MGEWQEAAEALDLVGASVVDVELSLRAEDRPGAITFGFRGVAAKAQRAAWLSHPLAPSR